MNKRGINVGVTKDPCYSRGILSVAALVPWLRPAPAIISSIRAPIIKGTIVTSLHFQSFLSWGLSAGLTTLPCKTLPFKTLLEN